MKPDILEPLMPILPILPDLDDQHIFVSVKIFKGEILINQIHNQGLNQYLVTGGLKLAILKFLGHPLYQGRPKNNLIFFNQIHVHVFNC